MVWVKFGWFGMVWFGLVWFGLVWFGLVWFGLVWFDLIWFGLVWLTKLTLHYPNQIILLSESDNNLLMKYHVQGYIL